MNVFYKAYCRIFQGVFRLALPVLPYKDPKILPRIADIPGEVKSRGLKRPLVVTDTNVYDVGAVAPLMTALGNADIEYTVFKDVV